MHFLEFLQPLSGTSQPSTNGSKYTCNCNEERCLSIGIYNCSSNIGCYVYFVTRPYKSVVYDCLERINHELIKNCEVHRVDSTTNELIDVRKCCYGNKCNVQKLVESYFPDTSKYPMVEIGISCISHFWIEEGTRAESLKLKWLHIMNHIIRTSKFEDVWNGKPLTISKITLKYAVLEDSCPCTITLKACYSNHLQTWQIYRYRYHSAIIRSVTIHWTIDPLR